MPAPDGGDDLTRVGGPNKRLGRLVCLLDEAIDRGFKLDDGMEDAALQALLGQFRKVSLHCIEPGTGRGREVKEEALVACEPRQNGWMLMSGVVVENDMDCLSSRKLGVDGVECVFRGIVSTDFTAS